MAGRNRFEFKRFAVDQQNCAMKVGTDGVLLGAWCRLRPHEDQSILDIGTGTGVIALQLAQLTERWNANIEAVEIDHKASKTAQHNFAASPWAARLKLHTMPAQEFAVTAAETSVDHIVTNPPYFSDSLISPDPSKTTARHTASLSHEELITVCDRLLKPNGIISLILPAGTEAEKMIAAARTHGFNPSRLTEVHSTPRSGPKRLLIELSRRAPAPLLENTTIVIEGDSPGTFSAEYRALTRDFYLYF